MSTIEQLEAKYVKKGINIGVEKGEEKKIKETILNMHQLGFDLETIQKVVKKDLDYIKEVIEENKDNE